MIQARFAAYQHKKSRDIKAESNLNNKNGKYTRIAIFEVVGTYYSDKIAAFISMIGSAMYLVLAGMPVSGQRALVVSYIFLIGIIIDRKPNALNSLCIGASLILLFQPEAIFSPSLQMSLSACLGLIVCYRFLGKFLFINLKQKNYVKRVFFYLLNITVSTLAAGLATAPFIIYHFHQFSTYSVIANLICIPLNDFFIMPLGILSMFLMPLGLEKIAIIPMEFGINIMLYVANLVYILPNSSFYVPSFSNYAIAVMVFGALLISFCRTKVRYLGIPMFVYSIATLFFHEQPSILISESGKLFAVRDKNEVLFSSGVKERYIRNIWMNELGVESLKTLAKSKIEGCNADICKYTKDSIRAVIVSKLDSLKEECEAVDLFVNLADKNFVCSSAKRSINLSDLNQKGAHLVKISGTEMVIVNVEDERVFK